MHKSKLANATDSFHVAANDRRRRSRRLKTRRVSASRFISPLVEQLETRRLLAGVWDGGGGDNNWNTPPNWDDDQLPGSSTNVMIGAAFAGITITSASSVS